MHEQRRRDVVGRSNLDHRPRVGGECLGHVQALALHVPFEGGGVVAQSLLQPFQSRDFVGCLELDLVAPGGNLAAGALVTIVLPQ